MKCERLKGTFEGSEVKQDGFRFETTLHQWSALSFLVSVVMDRLMDEMRQKSPWTTVLADDMVMCVETRLQTQSVGVGKSSGEKRSDYLQEQS